METHTILDPFLVALPTEPTPEGLERYFHAVSRWGAAIERDSESFSFSEAALARLSSEGATRRLRKCAPLIAVHNLKSVTAYDVANRVRFLAGRRPYLEDRTGISAVAVDTDHGIDPPMLCERLGAYVGQRSTTRSS